MGPGLISAQGQQHVFDLQQHWRSDKPPVTGAKVDMDMNADGQLGAVRAVDESQLAKELAQAGVACGALFVSNQPSSGS